jgi:hypothetical protein
MSIYSSIKSVVTKTIKVLGLILLEIIRAALKLVLFVAAVLVLIVFCMWLTADSTSPKLSPLLTELVNTVNEHRISRYHNQDWCKSIESETGNYADKPSSTCGSDDENKPFDAHGAQLFALVSYAATKAHIAPIRIDIQSEHGRVTFARIDLSCLFGYAAYVYSPQKTYVTQERKPTDVRDMTGGWYYENRGI